MRLSDKILDILEDAGFAASKVGLVDGKFFVDISQYTPADEDWGETIWYDGTEENFTGAVRTLADNFDVDEETEKWIECRGKDGCPSSIKELYEDAEWKKDKLIELAYSLEDYRRCF